MGKTRTRKRTKRQRFISRQQRKGRSARQAAATWKMIRAGCAYAKRQGVRPNPEPGTVSHGTLRPEDLIPTFLDALDDAIEESTFEPGADAPHRVARVGSLQSALGSLERRMDEPGYYDSEAVEWDLEWLFEQLNEFAPAGHYFGAHPGDGSDFGFWAHEED